MWDLTEAEWRQRLSKAEEAHSYVYEQYMKAACKERKYLRAIGAWVKMTNFTGMLVEMFLFIVMIKLFFR